MNVLVLTNMYPRPDRPTFGIFVKEQVEDLVKLGCRVDVRVIGGDRSKVNYFRAAATIRRIVLDHRYDILHAHYGLTGAVGLAQRRVPVVVTFHGSDCNGESPWQTLVSWFVSRAATPIFVSEPLARGLRLPSAPVIPAAVDTERFRPMSRETARGRLGWKDDAVSVLFPGSRSQYRKRADLFDAALEVARATEPRIRGVSMENLSREEVALTMNAVDAVLMTSNYEGSPVAVKEALACCTPVVSVPVADVPNLIAGLPGCEVVPRVPKELGAAVLRAVRAGKSLALRDRVEPFSRIEMAAEVRRVYEATLGLAQAEN